MEMPYVCQNISYADTDAFNFEPGACIADSAQQTVTCQGGGQPWVIFGSRGATFRSECASDNPDHKNPSSSVKWQCQNPETHAQATVMSPCDDVLDDFAFFPSCDQCR